MRQGFQLVVSFSETKSHTKMHLRFGSKRPRVHFSLLPKLLNEIKLDTQESIHVPPFQPTKGSFNRDRSFEEVLQAQGGRKRKQPRSPGPKPRAFCPGLRAELVLLVTCFFKSIFSWDQTTVILAAQTLGEMDFSFVC